MHPLQLAWANLVHQRVRTLISTLGVAFAVVLVFMQLGFLHAVERTATLLFDQLSFDLLMISKDYRDLGHPSTLPRPRLGQARVAPEVVDVVAVSTSTGLWREPDVPERTVRKRLSLFILGVDPPALGRLFRDPVPNVVHSAEVLAEHRSALGRLGTVLFDRRSWPEYGTSADWRQQPTTELNDVRVRVGGEIEVGTGFSYNGLALTSEATFALVTGRSPTEVTFGLVRLAPGSDARAVADRLTAVLPKDVRVLTRAEINEEERRYWVEKTSIGQFIRFGVGVALAVGVIFVYQMMVGDIRKHLPEYATVKALGYPGGFLTRVVLSQGGLLALAGYVPGVLVSLGLYVFTAQMARIPIGMTGLRLAGVLVLAVGMCLVSAGLAVRKVHTADPADLF